MWAAYSFPGFEIADDESYEYLQQLCDEIGEVYVGVDNIDEVAPLTTTESDFKCPICLEYDAASTRQTVLCQHKFCSPCLEKWLSMRKTCPMCMQSLDS